MTRPREPDTIHVRPLFPPIDGIMRAQEIRESAATLAEHLRRSGVPFIPQPNPDQVQQLVDSFDTQSPAGDNPVPRPDASEASTGPIPSSTTPGSTRARPGRPAADRQLLVEPAGAHCDPYPGPALPLAEREAVLAKLSSEVAACTRCPQLVACRNHTVFGEGSAEPRFAFFGEGPGADEDRTGRPFVGRAGQLLTKMIEACKLRREDVYILNTVKCRPPGNRNPEPTEIEHCRTYFENQLSTLRPEYIVCLGAVAAQSLLRSKLSVGRLRGRIHPYFDSKVVVTYHPAYLLRNPSAKKATWEDLQMMLADAGISLK